MLEKRRQDLELLVSAFAPPPPLKVLELGFGSGVNAKFFHDRGDTYTGIDRSLADLRKPYFGLGTFILGDFCREMPKGFDLIVERAGFNYNDDAALRRAVGLIHGALMPGGMFISADLYGPGNTEIGRDGARAFTLDGLKELFAPFETLHLADTKALHRFDFVGRKRT